MDLVDICEKRGKINLSYVYKECTELSDSAFQEDEYSGYYIEDNAKQILKCAEEVDSFVTSYLHEFYVGKKKGERLLENRKYLP